MADGGRGSARVLVVNSREEVLLLLARMADGELGLMSPGGGIEPGEGPRDAAVRELREETGIEVGVADLLGPLHDGPVRWVDHAGEPGVYHSTIFAAAVPDPEVSFAGHTPQEVGFLVGHTWVDPTTLTSDPRLRTPLLPDLATRAVAAVRSGLRPTDRRTARVLPVSPEGAVLLLQDQDPAVPGLLRWGTIGGAVDPGETLQDAAVRETFEETGIVVGAGDLRGPVHHDTREFTYAGRAYLGHSSFYAVPLDRDVEVSFAHLEPDEVGNVVAHGWWTPDDLAAEGTAVAPDLPDIMRAAVAALEGER
jgi:8-oxo-dGTP pyrophosphatase MutT (NUDIX family)